MQDVIDPPKQRPNRPGQNVEETYYWLGNALTLERRISGAIEAYEQAQDQRKLLYAQWAIDSLN